MAATIALSNALVRSTGARYRVRLMVGAGGLALGWLLGFGWFLWLTSQSAAPAPAVDAIVVLTGGPDRVEVGLRLLAGGTGRRLLVSGAGEKTDLAALARRAELDPAPLEQRITLGHAAHSTRGNALETADWAREHDTHSLLVVTSWFHMPRALVELRRAMPAVTILPYPVGHLDAGEFTHPGMARRLVGEYHKYLAALTGLTGLPLMIAAWGTE